MCLYYFFKNKCNFAQCIQLGRKTSFELCSWGHRNCKLFTGLLWAHLESHLSSRNCSSVMPIQNNGGGALGRLCLGVPLRQFMTIHPSLSGTQFSTHSWITDGSWDSSDLLQDFRLSEVSSSKLYCNNRCALTLKVSNTITTEQRHLCWRISGRMFRSIKKVQENGWSYESLAGMYSCLDTSNNQLSQCFPHIGHENITVIIFSLYPNITSAII